MEAYSRQASKSFLYWLEIC